MTLPSFFKMKTPLYVAEPSSVSDFSVGFTANFFGKLFRLSLLYTGSFPTRQLKTSRNLKSGTLVKFLVHWEKIRFSLCNGFARSPSSVLSCSLIEILGSTGASSSNFWDFHLLTFLTKFYQFNLTFS